MSSVIQSIYQCIRDVPDFPKPGILFKDITPLLLDRELFGQAIELMVRPYRGVGVTRVVAIESRGFLLGAPIALSLGAGLAPIRKPGKLPAASSRVEYALEYGIDALEMHRDAVTAADKVLIVDDVLATGGTAAAARELVAQHHGEVAGFSFLIELDFLRGRARIDSCRVEALLHYT